MKPRSLLFTLSFLALVFAPPGMAQSKKIKKINRKLMGDELANGREAAEFGLWNEAIFQWEKVVAKDPDNADATNNLAVAYESIGAYDKAEKLYQTALDLDEDSQEIRKNLKRFRSFYRKHKRQLAREKKVKEKKRAEAEAKAKNEPEDEEDDTPSPPSGDDDVGGGL